MQLTKTHFTQFSPIKPASSMTILTIEIKVQCSPHCNYINSRPIILQRRKILNCVFFVSIIYSLSSCSTITTFLKHHTSKHPLIWYNTIIYNSKRLQENVINVKYIGWWQEKNQSEYKDWPMKRVAFSSRIGMDRSSDRSCGQLREPIDLSFPWIWSSRPCAGMYIGICRNEQLELWLRPLLGTNEAKRVDTESSGQVSSILPSHSRLLRITNAPLSLSLSFCLESRAFNALATPDWQF